MQKMQSSKRFIKNQSPRLSSAGARSSALAVVFIITTVFFRGKLGVKSVTARQREQGWAAFTGCDPRPESDRRPSPGTVQDIPSNKENMEDVGGLLLLVVEKLWW
ncbi:hypothetical protein AAFF_G00284210 [Aldrovandia affinis]|uniref:Uncharacterized protein n=1 Tax=Aldrovandia affinis TaxID=143900 RepID=A0AAD7X2N7_9TELE|nr:hypothetical protein AAFF_G00284210 [Aldrovandia affinis]